MADVQTDLAQGASCPAHHLGKDYNPFASPQLECPYPVWAEARTEAPVFFSEVLQAWIVTRYEDFDRIVRDPATFSSEIDDRLYTDPSPEVVAILEGIPSIQDTKNLVNDPPRHTRLRQYAQQHFLPKRLAAREDDIRALAHRLIDQMEKRPGGEFYTSFASPFALEVMGIVLRLPREQLEQIHAWTEADMIFRHGNPTHEQAIAGARAQRGFWNFAVELLENRRAEPMDDFVSDAVRWNDANPEPLSLREMVGQVVVVFLGGFETTANWLAMAMQMLLEGDRSRWEALKDGSVAVTSVIEETLRMRGSAQMNWRIPKVDVELSGVRIPAGSKIGIGNLAANRDPAIFENPDTYDPFRSGLSRHVAFGKGIHTCVGAGVARQEGRVALTALAERLPDIRIDPAAEPIAYLPSAMLVMPRGLHLVWNAI